MKGLVLRPSRRSLLPWISAVVCALALAAPLAAQPALSTFGSMGWATLSDVAVDANGQSVVTGQFFYTVDFDPGPGTAIRTGGSNQGDVFIARYDATGAFVSVVTLGASFSTYGASVAVDASGDAVVTGRFKGALDFDPSPSGVVRSSLGADGDVFVARYTAAGAFVSVATVVGTTGGAELNVALDPSGQSVVTGTFVGTVDFDPTTGTDASWRTASGALDAFVARYTAAGAFVSVATFGATGRITTSGIATAPSGQAVVTGKFQGTVDFDPGPGISNRTSVNTNAGGGDMYLARYSPDGTLASVTTFPTSATLTSTDVAVDAGGNAVVTGSFGGTVDFDPGFAAVTRSGTNQAFVARYTPTGAFVSVASFGSTDIYVGTGIALEASGTAVVAGSFAGTVDFDPGPGTASRSSLGYANTFVARYTAAGAFVSVVTFGGTASAIPSAVAVDASGQAVVPGAFRGTVDFDPGPETVSRTTASNAGAPFLVRYAADGALVSVATFGDTGSITSGGVAVDAIGQSVVSGSFSGIVDFDPGPGVVSRTSTGTSDAYLARYSATTGALVSVVTFGGSGSSIHGTKVALDASGQAVVAGRFQGTVDFDPGPATVNRTGEGTLNVFVARYSVEGALVSIVTFAPPSTTNSTDVAVAPNGDAVVTGTFSGTVDFDPGPGAETRTSSATSAFVARYTAAGAFVSVATFGGPGTASANSVAVTPSGDAVVTGTFSGTVDFDPSPLAAGRTSAGGTDVFVARYSASGAFVSVVAFGGAGSDFGTGIALDASENAVVAGSFAGTVDFDPGPGAETRTAIGGSDAFVARYNADGTFGSVLTLGDEASLSIFAVAVDQSGDAIVAGTFRGTADFDPGPGTASRSSVVPANGRTDAFVARYTAAGAFVSATVIGDDHDDAVTDVVTDANGHAVVTGHFLGTVDFEPGDGAVIRTSANNLRDVFVARYTADGALVIGTNTSVEAGEVAHASDVRLSGVAPNPTRGLSQVRIEVATSQRVTVGLYDVLGRRVAEVFEGALSPGAAETVAVDVSTLPVGVYVVRVEGARGVVARALVVAR